jgi:hypothetical protein
MPDGLFRGSALIRGAGACFCRQIGIERTWRCFVLVEMIDAWAWIDATIPITRPLIRTKPIVILLFSGSEWEPLRVASEEAARVPLV